MLRRQEADKSLMRRAKKDLTDPGGRTAHMALQQQQQTPSAAAAAGGGEQAGDTGGSGGVRYSSNMFGLRAEGYGECNVLLLTS